MCFVVNGYNFEAPITTNSSNNDLLVCLFSLQNHTPKTPLILKNQAKLEVLYPDTIYNTIRIRKDEKIKLSCGDKKFKKYHDKQLIVTCIKNDFVNVTNKPTKFKTLECEFFPRSEIRILEKNCYKNKTLIEVGFREKQQFLRTMVACFDQDEARAVYTWYNSSLLHTGHMSKVQRPFFEDDNLYKFNVSDSYGRNQQRKRLEEILKSESLAKKYIKNDDEHFLSRGHLTPKADFVHGFEQASTFHYINAAPQWQVFNGGNWVNVESDVRNLLKKTKDR